nr:uncharacterized protein C4orf51 homolog isoform X2 [Ictidomys tridecemlineatus]XP_040148854.1 uncharacterized protein C4orf51 homolog isoform X2 [Ictidomys tridecemlineatus]
MTTYEGSYRKKQLDEFPVSRQHEPQRPQMVMLKDMAHDLPPCQETADVIEPGRKGTLAASPVIKKVTRCHLLPRALYCSSITSTRRKISIKTLTQANRAGTLDSSLRLQISGLFPNITGTLKNSLNVKHRVAHQVWGFGDLSRAPPNSRKICVKPKKVYFDILEHCNRGRKNFPEILYKQCESESKILGSSEDSEGGQHRGGQHRGGQHRGGQHRGGQPSGYGRGRLLSLFD